jgi:hypothetical protein
MVGKYDAGVKSMVESSKPLKSPQEHEGANQKHGVESYNVPLTDERQERLDCATPMAMRSRTMTTAPRMILVHIAPDERLQEKDSIMNKMPITSATQLCHDAKPGVSLCTAAQNETMRRIAPNMILNHTAPAY